MKSGVKPILAFEDNYIWLISNRCHAVVVDPGDAEAVKQVLRAQNLQLLAILITHHHFDHTGGIASLLQDFPALRIYGPGNEDISHITHAVQEPDSISIPELEIEFQVLDVPGHTRGHIAYYGDNGLFCGDTVFSAGCGRLFEGSAIQMQQSLAKISALPEATQIYCAHEYTLDNLGFALWVEPDNTIIQRRQEAVRELRRLQQASVPSTLALEKQTNPFLRTGQTVVRKAAEVYAGKSLDTEADIFAAIRAWKDREYD